VVLARALTVLGIVLVVISLLANFVKREALDEEQFRDTSRALIADDAVRDQLAVTLVDQLYANVDVSGTLEERLPDDLQGLAGPIAGAARQGADRAAENILERPRVQDLFVGVSSAAQQQFVAVLDDDTRALETSGGKVVLDVRPLVLELGDRFELLPDLESQIPEDAAKVTILESDELETAQNATQALRFVADWIWILALAAWAGAVGLARGRRRIEIRAISVGLVVAGFLVLIARALAGRYVVDELVASDSVRPAVASAYDIVTALLAGAGWSAVLVGGVALVGVWLAGEGPRARVARRGLAPYLRRPEIAYGTLVVAYLLLLWWQPTPQFGFLRNVVIFFVLALAGLEVLRRQSAAEFPDARPGEATASLRGALASIRRPPASNGRTEELERLARLHAQGDLDDAEFASAKAVLFDGEGVKQP
jgi:hypothetical protein